MRFKLAVVVGTLFLALGACTAKNNTSVDANQASPSIGPDEFSLAGQLIDAKAGITPPSASPSPSVLPSPTASPSDDVGGLAVKPTTDADAVNIDNCTKNQGTFIAYYDANTTFEPSSVSDDPSFPENVQGHEVMVTGAIDNCVLTAEQVVVTDMNREGESGGTTTGNSGGNGAGGGSTASPGVSPSGTGGSGEFPGGNNGTDPIFEGTASPDPCEGAKACEQHENGNIRPTP